MEGSSQSRAGCVGWAESSSTWIRGRAEDQDTAQHLWQPSASREERLHFPGDLAHFANLPLMDGIRAFSARWHTGDSRAWLNGMRR